jgi:16S rRNA (guanine966-N2)-methyltransferase
MNRHRSPSHRSETPSGPLPNKSAKVTPVGVRIIAGRFRGRKLLYSGNLGVRPMKDRVRQALFNMLGATIEGTHALDLFAGTGALGLEAISRGAALGTLIEHHAPTAEVVRRNVASLGLESICRVLTADVFRWVEHSLPSDATPWAVFCSPPYSYWVELYSPMLELVTRLIDRSPPNSLFVVESDERFDFATLPSADAWDVREYPPARIGMWWKS